MILQIVDARTLRKLQRRIDELSDVKNFLSAVDASGSDMPIDSYLESLSKLLDLKKVKENQHMTAFLQEIQALLKASDIEGARKVVLRILEVKPVHELLRDVKEVPHE